MSTLSGISGASNAWTNVAQQRNQAQARMFAKVDTDGSGGVDAAELSTMVGEVAKKTGVSLEGTPQELLATMDGDQDGALSSDELAEGMRALMPPPTTMDFAQARGDGAAGSPGDDLFGKLDANGDGSLDGTEVQALTDRIQADTGEDTSDRFNQLDSDGDGKLTQAEFDAGRPEGPPPAAPEGATSAAAAQGTGGARPAGGAAAAGGATEDDGSYDPLDTNRDGTVSELERLVGALNDATQGLAKGQDTSAELSSLATALYERLSETDRQPLSGRTLDTTA